MANLNNENVRIQVLVTKDTPIGRYQDALYFSPDEFNAISQDDVDAMAQKRADDWVASVQAASKIDYVPTAEELQAQKADLQAQLDAVDTQLAEVSISSTSVAS